MAPLIYYALFALQHRGQESAGIAVSDGSAVIVYKEMGLVAQVFDTATLATLQGHLGIGHVRYSTTGSSKWENAQPVFKPFGETGLALAHNGNLVNAVELARALGRERGAATSDSDLIATRIQREEGKPLPEAVAEAASDLKGAFSLVVMDAATLVAARDPYGLRPLSLGRLGRGWVVASETAALDHLGASYVRDVEPGEVLAIDTSGLRSLKFAEPRPALCIFEFIYLARPDSILYGKTVQSVRRELGRRLAELAPVEADLVVGVPETGVVAAAGYAEVSGIPYGEALVRNRYVWRTFIQPSDTLRKLGIRLKLNPLKEAVAGKRLVVVDDSIVRGNTTRQIVALLREAGAREVHLRITSPPIRWPCFYGIDMSTRAELIAADLQVEEVRAFLGADSLFYLPIEAMVGATGEPRERFCRACFDGEYPIPIPEVAPAKDALERKAPLSETG